LFFFYSRRTHSIVTEHILELIYQERAAFLAGLSAEEREKFSDICPYVCPYICPYMYPYMSHQERAAFLAGLSAEEREKFLANMSEDERAAFLKAEERVQYLR